MSDAISPVSSSSSSSPVAATQGSEQSQSPAAAVNASTTISSVGDLKQKAPKVYDGMLISIATKIVQEMRRSQEHLKKINDEARRGT